MSNLYKGLLFIGDALISNTKPGRRSDDNYLKVVRDKLLYSLEIAREKNLKPIILGGLTNKTFEVRVLSALVEILVERDVLVLASNHDYVRGEETLNPNSTLGIIQASRIASVITHTGFAGQIEIDLGNNETKTVSLYSVAESGAIPNSLGFKEGVTEESIGIIIARANIMQEGDESTSNIQPYEIPGCHLVACGLTRLPYGPNKLSNTTWLAPGALSRTDADQDAMKPTVWEWSPESGLNSHIVPHQASVMDLSGLASDRVKEAYTNSAFATLLREETLRANDSDDNTDILDEEMTNIFKDKKTGLDCREIIMNLKKQTDSELVRDLDDELF